VPGSVASSSSPSLVGAAESGDVTERTAAVVTVSDSVSAGTNPDASGGVVVEVLTGLGFAVTETSVIPTVRSPWPRN